MYLYLAMLLYHEKRKGKHLLPLSFTEAEYIARSEAAKEAMWMRRLMREIETKKVCWEDMDLAKYHKEEIEHQLKPWEEAEQEEDESWNKDMVTLQPQKIMADNQGCIKLVENILSTSRAKHIEIRYHYVRDMHKQGKIELLYEPTAMMMADIWRKALLREGHWTPTE